MRKLIITVCCLIALAVVGHSISTEAGNKKAAEKALKLPDGVIHVSLPPGEVRMENIVRKGKYLIRLNVDKTVIEARTMFLGDSKGATHFESTKEGIHWLPASGGKGFLFGNGSVSSREPGSTIEEPDFYPLDKLNCTFRQNLSSRHQFHQAFA